MQAPGRCSSYIGPNCEKWGGGGDTPTEPYIAGHNILLAHAKAAKLYKQKYQPIHGGEIGICTASPWFEPWDVDEDADYGAVDIRVIFEYSWMLDPIVFGRYPKVMEEMTQDRLPKFTPEEQELLKGSYDYLGLNHYYTYYIHRDYDQGRDYGSDSQIWTSPYNKTNHLIGPFADSSWLNVYPQGIKSLLQWIDSRYNGDKIYVFENGVSVPHEWDKTIEEALKDQFRQDYYSSYLSQVSKAYKSGVNIHAWFAWSIIDNFEWTAGYYVRFGMVYIDYDHDQKRYIKDSAKWYSDYIVKHTVSYDPEFTEAKDSPLFMQ